MSYTEEVGTLDRLRIATIVTDKRRLRYKYAIDKWLYADSLIDEVDYTCRRTVAIDFLEDCLETRTNFALADLIFEKSGILEK